MPAFLYITYIGANTQYETEGIGGDVVAEVQPGVYCIRIKERIDSQWKDSLGDLQIEYSPAGETLICGLFIDQAALHGLLDRIRDFNLTLISVTPVESK